MCSMSVGEPVLVVGVAVLLSLTLFSGGGCVPVEDGAADDVDVGGDVSVGGDVDVGGDVSVGGDVDVGGDIRVGGDVDVGGIVAESFADVCDMTLESLRGCVAPISSVRCHARSTLMAAPPVHVPSLPPARTHTYAHTCRAVRAKRARGIGQTSE